MVITRKHGAASHVITPCREPPAHAGIRVTATSSSTSLATHTSLNPVDGWCMPLLSLIVALLLFCRGCMCSSECTMSWVKVKDPCYVTISKNITSVVGVATGGECLIMCGEHIYGVCESSNKGCGLTKTDCERRTKIRDAKTDFCGLPLSNVLSNESRHAVLSNSNKKQCRTDLDYVVQIDNRARELYISFLDVLERVDCFGYSNSGSCRKCKEELDETVRVWNVHHIRPSRNEHVPSGRPMVMYELPQLFNTRDYMQPVSMNDIEACEAECLFRETYPCDIDVFNLCSVVMNELDLRFPNDPFDGIDLYMSLRQTIRANVL